MKTFLLFVILFITVVAVNAQDCKVIPASDVKEMLAMNAKSGELIVMNDMLKAEPTITKFNVYQTYGHLEIIGVKSEGGQTDKRIIEVIGPCPPICDAQIEIGPCPPICD